jgi:putative ABC transport system permease protein
MTATDLLEGDSLGRERFAAWLFGAFALIGTAFAVSGIYCIQSYLVAQRTRELGLRVAMGARPLHILRLVTGSTCAAVLLGAGAGISIDLALSKIFAQWTSGNSSDPKMLFVITMLLFAAAIVASIAPARLAVSASPMDALRSE